MGEKDRFLIKHWADGSVVFDRQFGDTHAIDPAASSIFISLQNGERDRAGLVEKISSFYPDATAQYLNDRLDDILVNLDKLGLMKAEIN